MTSAPTSGEPLAPDPLAGMTAVLGFPHNCTMHPEAMISVTQAAERLTCHVKFAASSLLAHTFNQLWAGALNEKPRPDLFALHHADLTAAPGWLDVLAEEMIRAECDLLSTVVAIKDPRGLTSTGLLDTKTSRLRRIVMKELAKLPETFDAQAVAEAWGLEDPAGGRYALCANTGLWVCKFGAWAEGVCFEMGDRIERHASIDDPTETVFAAHVFPEDWMFSATLATLGLKVKVTQKVRTFHFGTATFAAGGITKPWGALDSDEWCDV